MPFRAQVTDVCLKKWRTISVGESHFTEQVPHARRQVCTGLGFLSRAQCEPCRLFSCLVPTDSSHMPAWRGLSQNNSNSNINHSNIKERGAGFLGTWPRIGPGLDFPMGGLVLSWGYSDFRGTIMITPTWQWKKLRLSDLPWATKLERRVSETQISSLSDFRTLAYYNES